jgi:hypothetical protein
MELCIEWIKAGLIGWGVWFIAAIIWTLIATKGNPGLIDRLTKNVDGPKYRDLPIEHQIRIVLRILLWPWGLLECSQILNRELKKVLE